MSMSKALSLSGRATVMMAIGPSMSMRMRWLRHGRPPSLRAALRRQLQPDRRLGEQRRIHLLELVGDDQREFRLVEDMRVCRSTPGAISVSTMPFGRQLHHAALGDIGDVLALLDGAAAGEGHVLDLVDQLLQLAFLLDDQPAVRDGELCPRALASVPGSRRIPIMANVVYPILYGFMTRMTSITPRFFNRLTRFRIVAGVTPHF